MRNKAAKYGIALVAIIIFAACSKVPKHILSEKDMQKVMTDMMMAESMIGTDYQSYRGDTVKLALYESVFAKHRISRELYDSSLVWYGQNLDIYMKVYDRVLTDINKMIADLGDVQADAAPTSNSDSINIWPRRSSLILQPGQPFNGVVFDIKPTSNYSSGSSFVLGLRVWGINKEMSFTPEIRLSAVQPDTIITTNLKIKEDGYYQTIVTTPPTKQIRRVYGYIWMDEKENSYHKIYIDSLNLMKYNYGSPALKLETEQEESETSTSQPAPNDSIP